MRGCDLWRGCGLWRGGVQFVYGLLDVVVLCAESLHSFDAVAIVAVDGGLYCGGHLWRDAEGDGECDICDMHGVHPLLLVPIL